MILNMWLSFFVAFLIFAVVMAYFYWVEKKERDRILEERLKKLEDHQKK